MISLSTLRPAAPAPEVVVITGASAGVGRAVAREFARRGASIGLIARGKDRLDSARREVEALGGRGLAIPADVADAKALERAAELVEQELGPIDIWVNNAFAGMVAPFMDMRLREFRRVTEVTYLGQVYGTRVALRRMLPRDRGSIVLVGSALAYRGIPLQSAYCGSKHAIQGFQDSVRAELLHAGSRVRLTMVQLPAVNTPQFDWIRSSMPLRPRPAARPYQPEVAARAIFFAAHARRKEVIVGSSAHVAIWADRFASPLLDRHLARTGYEAQQDGGARGQARQGPDNLVTPPGGDPGAQGSFGAEARRTSATLWLTLNRGWLTLGAATVGIAAGAALRALRGARQRGAASRDERRALLRAPRPPLAAASLASSSGGADNHC